MRSRLFCVAAAFVLGACGGDGGGGGYTTGGGNPGGGSGNPTATNAVSVSDNTFTPAAAQVSVGTTVTWTWGSEASVHNVTFTDGVKSQDLGKSATYRRTFAAAGTFNYSCTIHPNMTGSVVVQ